MLDLQRIYDFIFQALLALIVNGASTLVVFIVLIIAKWNMFKKAGQPGWAAVVPIYNKYICYKTAGRNRLFWAWLGLSIAVKVIYAAVIINFIQMTNYTKLLKYNEASQVAMTEFTLIIGIVIIWVIMFAFNTAMYITLAQRFGRGVWFGLGLAIFTIIFMFVIVFDSNIQYVQETS